MHEWLLPCTATNLVGLPPGLLGSVDFNDHPVRLRIHGTRESARGLFSVLDTVASLDEASEVFKHFMTLSFGLTPDHQARQRSERLRWKSSYLKVLEGWGFDANGPQASVLKGWVESRFGLVPTYHRGLLDRFPSEAWMHYIEDKFSSRYHNNNIDQQLDLLFEFCQWCARRFGLPARTRIKVWRGINKLHEHRLLQGSLRERHGVLLLNNLNSFSLSRERAETFGDWILETEVPVQKLVFFPGLLGRSLLAGEGEIIALGGAYRVSAHYA
ncbi:MAG TPA: NAD(+)--dinitrogen-reductase ADP-D-ribosyltransferase [Aquabacterium sp.]|uniref:NAD(+)--dinitrogen-reductase ADP-D-ribosyltransferase n=1 Tax=Aquabacterium sp. TaxID=1872578 RepID=UPI002D81BC87|nr:NAD(+)--dinitrogen-reductase ADP-D-ribosyltransferase [Aquabacterium sp.]HET6787387.1 NAD(+)--dinitrogen-reductase ADP-D-ribosyltransferase [Aquabacterium sp.]HEX5373879.1 NAD(+)--dinitrogen-reductase ADP-D-ribosyltransferase [Aquabacterium sp.]